MTAPEDAVVVMRYRAECLQPGCGWKGGDREDREEANLDRRLHLLEHVFTELKTDTDGGPC